MQRRLKDATQRALCWRNTATAAARSTITLK